MGRQKYKNLKALHRQLRDIANSLKIIKGSLEWLKNTAVLDKKLSQVSEMLQ